MTDQDESTVDYERHPGLGYLRHQSSKNVALFQIWDDEPRQEQVRAGYALPAHLAQAEGVVFTDGTVVIKWLTPRGNLDLCRDLDYAKEHVLDLYHLGSARWRWIA